MITNQTEKSVIVQQEQDLAERLNLIKTIADLNSAQLEDFHNDYFPSLSPSVQTGLMKLEKAVWAIAKTLKKAWPRLKEMK